MKIWIGKILHDKENFINFYGNDYYADLYIEYKNNEFPIRINGEVPDTWESKTDGCYVVNSNNEIFSISDIVERNHEYNFSKDLKEFDFYDTFEMSKFDATDIITVVIDLKGTPVHIKLEKIVTLPF